MIIWLCDKCGCELKQEDKPDRCPLCMRRDAEFEKIEKKDPDIEEKESTKKYEEIVDELEKYSEDCEPEQSKYSVEY
ncbi:MAG: hypothetical protein ISS25_04090 [Nanoarchaeota archaeon]|nr:hypothetical protein [DPANN group archaeon]MBL7116981.1 hypothetical protein [Nanoarchaeota archaeon]